MGGGASGGYSVTPSGARVGVVVVEDWEGARWREVVVWKRAAPGLSVNSSSAGDAAVGGGREVVDGKGVGFGAESVVVRPVLLVVVVVVGVDPAGVGGVGVGAGPGAEEGAAADGGT